VTDKQPGGALIDVDDHNLEEYLELVLDRTLGSGIARQAKAFQDGESLRAFAALQVADEQGSPVSSRLTTSRSSRRKNLVCLSVTSTRIGRKRVSQTGVVPQDVIADHQRSNSLSRRITDTRSIVGLSRI
jgi:hypothetical protein